MSGSQRWSEAEMGKCEVIFERALSAVSRRTPAVPPHCLVLNVNYFVRYNLGNLYVELKRPEDAIRNYQAAIKIDDLFYPAKVNLAMLYNQLGKNNKSERLLHEVVQAHPQMYELQYSLSLLLAEQKKYLRPLPTFPLRHAACLNVHGFITIQA